MEQVGIVSDLLDKSLTCMNDENYQYQVGELNYYFKCNNYQYNATK